MVRMNSVSNPSLECHRACRNLDFDAAFDLLWVRFCQWKVIDLTRFFLQPLVRLFVILRPSFLCCVSFIFLIHDRLPLLRYTVLTDYRVRSIHPLLDAAQLSEADNALLLAPPVTSPSGSRSVSFSSGWFDVRPPDCSSAPYIEHIRISD